MTQNPSLGTSNEIIQKPRGVDELGSTPAEWSERYGSTPFNIDQARGRLEASDFGKASSYLADLAHADLLISDLGRTLRYDNPELKERMLTWWYDQQGKVDWQAARTRKETEDALRAKSQN